MFHRIVKFIPNRWIVYLWRKLPIPHRIKQKIFWSTNRKFFVAVLGLIQNDRGEILLLHHTYRDEPWGLPSGVIEWEHPADGLIREVYEETGLTISVDRILQVDYGPNPHHLDLYYLGRVTGGTFRPSAEVSQYAFFPIGHWPEGMPQKQKNMVTQLLQRE
jgi:8-oxo-dGTP diphosphatase